MDAKSVIFRTRAAAEVVNFERFGIHMAGQTTKLS